MNYEVLISPAAERQLKKLARGVQRRIVGALEALGRDPRPRGARKLKGVQNNYRVRIGDYRAIYEIQDKEVVVLVLKVGHRQGVYGER